MSRVIVLSVGHTGSRIIGQVLERSGYKVGQVNGSFDTVKFTGADRKRALEFAKSASHRGDQWSWAPTIRPEGYLDDAPEAWKHGWPSLCMPWLVGKYPNARYIRWIRDPRDTVLWKDVGVDMFISHKIPGFEGLEYEEAAGQFIRYWWQQQMIYCPKFCLQIKYEDYCDDPEAQTSVLEAFLGRRMAVSATRCDRIGRWKKEATPPAESAVQAAKELYYEHVPHRLYANLQKADTARTMQDLGQQSDAPLSARDRRRQSRAGSGRDVP